MADTDPYGNKLSRQEKRRLARYAANEALRDKGYKRKTRRFYLNKLAKTALEVEGLRGAGAPRCPRQQDKESCNQRREQRE